MLADRIVLASGNAGKLRELQQLLAPFQVTLVTQKSLQITDAEETGLTFIENAIIKARHASAQSGMPAIADDSGLAVDALQGAPGIYSARYVNVAPQGQQSGNRDADNNQKLLQMLSGVPDEERTAKFHCVLVYLRHAEDPVPLVCHGQWQGKIGHAVSGDGGFGYDPLFHIPDLNCTAAQLAPQQKNRLSHRAQAMQQLLQALHGGSSNPAGRHNAPGNDSGHRPQ